MRGMPARISSSGIPPIGMEWKSWHIIILFLLYTPYIEIKEKRFIKTIKRIICVTICLFMLFTSIPCYAKNNEYMEVPLLSQQKKKEIYIV